MQDAITYEHFRRRPSVTPSIDAPTHPTTSSPPRALDPRRKSVVFAPSTYVDHPGVTWEESDDDDDDDEDDPEAGMVESELAMDDAPEEDMDTDQETITTGQVVNVTTPHLQTPLHQSYAAQVETTPLEDSAMEPDDGIAWSDAAARESQQRVVDHAEGRDSPSSRYGALGVARGPSTGVPRPEAPVREPGPAEPAQREMHPAEIIESIRQSPLDNQRASIRASPSPRSVSATSQVSASSYASTMTARSDSISPDLGDGRKSKKDGSARKKRSGVFSGLFKKKEKKPVAAGEDKARGSDESFVNRSQGAPALLTGSPLGDRPAITLTTALPTDDRPAAISPHALRMQQMDQQQHKRYQEYMARSPGGEMEPAARAYGTQAAAAINASYASRLADSTNSLPNGRPGSIMIHPSSTSASAELTVLRVFAGDTIDSESTFKTVLTNENTSAKRLVQQAVQRLQLAADDEYYLVIKEVDGGQVELTDDEKVLEKFFAMNQHYDDDGGIAKRVRKSSIGSISSIASNLSQHPAIRKFASNDFSDDSSVKLFLHRRLPLNGHPDTSVESIPTTPTRAKPFPHLAVATQADTSPGSSTGSPTAKFSMQIVIFAEDLPEGMAFDSQTEAVVPRAMLRQRGADESTASRKLLLIPRNATVAEAIEAGLERFGISGVVAGGDDVEDKISKRRSFVRVRYGLVARLADNEGMLLLSSGDSALTFPQSHSHRITRSLTPIESRPFSSTTR